MTNQEIVSILNFIATALEFQGENPFKIKAYQKAARSIEALTTEVTSLVERGELRQIEGIGEAIEKKITELVKTGRLEYYEKLKASIPEGLFELLKIPHLGPKKLKILHEKLGITTLGELEYACHENRLLELPGFGKKTQQAILEGIQFVKSTWDQFRLGEALPVALELKKLLKDQAPVTQISLTGGIRRWKEVIKDIDLVASSSEPEKVLEIFIQLPQIGQILSREPSRCIARLANGIPVDLNLVSEEIYPYFLFYSTGSKDFLKAVQDLVAKKGLILNDRGLFKKGQKLTCQSEEEIFQHLGLPYIPPELRENTGELVAAREGRLPSLVEEKDILGLLHVHTHWSDGIASIQEMAEAAQEYGYEYIGISDHSKAAFYAHGLDKERLLKQWEEIDRVNRKLQGIRVLKGMEVDILADGTLDLEEAVLAQLDFVVASVHSRFKMNRDEMTRRILKAMENPYVTILGHPTGRLILSREPYQVDMEALLEGARRNGVAMELNAHPHRLDLHWLHLKRAMEKGVKVSINPDAHQVEGLGDMIYGIGTARRGWVPKEAVLNTLPWEEFKKKLKSPA
jgi:DNA polymerase (family 10)